MLQLSLFEVIFLLIPESLILLFSFYVFSFTGLKLKKIILSSILMVIMIYLVRLLPIQTGVHTLILIPINILILRLINGIPVIKAATSIILSLLLLFFCELVSLYFISSILKVNVEMAFQNVVTRTFYGYISLVLHFIIVVVFFLSIYKKKRLSVNNIVY
ncbi:MAG: hypothetical protein AB6733_02225 [Clostridiaceae bacterium]